MQEEGNHKSLPPLIWRVVLSVWLGVNADELFSRLPAANRCDVSGVANFLISKRDAPCHCQIRDDRVI